MNKDERERLVKVEAVVPLVEEIRADVKLLLARQSRIDGFISATAVFLTGIGATIGAVLATYWPKIKAWL